MCHGQGGQEPLHIVLPVAAADHQPSGLRISHPQLPFVVSVEFGDRRFQRLTPKLEPTIPGTCARPGQPPGELCGSNGSDALDPSVYSQLIARANHDLRRVLATRMPAGDSNGVHQPMHDLTKVDSEGRAGTGNGRAADQEQQARLVAMLARVHSNDRRLPIDDPLDRHFR